jgi:signal transduction histidine kinase
MREQRVEVPPFPTKFLAGARVGSGTEESHGQVRHPQSKPRMFKLIRYFSITSLIITTVAAAALGMFYRRQALRDLQELGESKNIALAQVFANAVWHHFAPFLRSASSLRPEVLRAHPETVRLDREIRDQSRGLAVVKVKIYDLAGRTIFSTEAKQIGEDKSTNPAFLAARSGQVTSYITHRDTFNAFEGVIENRDLLASYIPIRPGSGPVEGVFELYYDMTPLLERLAQTQRTVVLGVITILALLYVALFLLVRHADRILRRQTAERGRAEEAVVQQSALLQATLDNITQGVSAFDKDLRLIAWNQRYFELRDFPPALARPGTPFADLIRYNAAHGEYGPGDPEEQVAQRLALARSSEPMSFERTRPNGTVIEVRRNPMPVGGFVTTLTDITDRKQADQMKSDFVSFVTHQLRTPLSGIKWMLELAVQEEGLPPEARSYLTDAQAAGERLIRLVNDLLDISRLERGKLTIVPQETRLGELTQCVLDELAPLIAEKGHHLAVTGAGEVPPVWADPQLLQQVILNLTSNAIKYTPPGGEIAIRMGREDATVHWAIQDSGIGIPKAAQEQLFGKFYRADNVYAIETEGTGLGLYLVRLILDQLAGRAWCESEEGKGATFTFTLPLREGG